MNFTLSSSNPNSETVVVGGGLAGLTAALILANAGHHVRLFEKSTSLGGRATSRFQDGYVLNQGPHALYAGGEGLKILTNLGIKVNGRKPKAAAFTRRQGQIVLLPYSPLDYLRVSYMTWSGKWQLMRFFVSLTMGRKPAPHLTVRGWIENSIEDHTARAIAYSVVRVTTYANAPHIQSAIAASTQIRLALSQSVLYVDGGWQSIVDGLHDAASLAGVHITTGARVERITRQGNIHLRDGTLLTPDAVIIATGPKTAGRLLSALTPEERQAWMPQGPQVRAATLDLALDRLPDPDRIFALDIDAPLYYSVHSATAKLAPDGAELVHVARYLEDDTSADPQTALQHRGELEAFMDDLQAGWRDQVVHQRYLPNMVVSNALHIAGKANFGRSPASVPGHPYVFAAGDWVGNTGMLADAAIASAAQAANLALQRSPMARMAQHVRAQPTLQALAEQS